MGLAVRLRWCLLVSAFSYAAAKVTGPQECKAAWLTFTKLVAALLVKFDRLVLPAVTCARAFAANLIGLPSSWSGTDPCAPVWTGVTCTSDANYRYISAM